MWAKIELPSVAQGVEAWGFKNLLEVSENLEREIMFCLLDGTVRKLLRSGILVQILRFKKAYNFAFDYVDVLGKLAQLTIK